MPIVLKAGRGSGAGKGVLIYCISKGGGKGGRPSKTLMLDKQFGSAGVLEDCGLRSSLHDRTGRVPVLSLWMERRLKS